MRKVNSIPYVTWDKDREMWMVFIPRIVLGKVKDKVFLGRWKDRVEAFCEFNKGMREVYGDGGLRMLIGCRGLRRRKFERLREKGSEESSKHRAEEMEMETEMVERGRKELLERVKDYRPGKGNGFLDRMFGKQQEA